MNLLIFSHSRTRNKAGVNRDREDIAGHVLRGQRESNFWSATAICFFFWPKVMIHIYSPKEFAVRYLSAIISFCPLFYQGLDALDIPV